MSYACCAALQEAVFTRLSGHTRLTDLVGTAIHDALPAGPLPDLYVRLGPEEARDRSDKTSYGAQHRFTISVVSTAPGFHAAKLAAAAISDALVDADLPMSAGRLVGLWFIRARAAQSRDGNGRRIDLTFGARVEHI